MSDVEFTYMDACDQSNDRKETELPPKTHLRAKAKEGVKKIGRLRKREGKHRIGRCIAVPVSYVFHF